MNAKPLLVGLGSAHGDDGVGFVVAEEIARKLKGEIDLLLAKAPAEILGSIEGRSRLILCDACCSASPPGTLHCWRWPTELLEATRFAGTHDQPLSAVLQLAEQLGHLPAETAIWGISIERAEPGTEISPTVSAAVPAIVNQICVTLRQFGQQISPPAQHTARCEAIRGSQAEGGRDGTTAGESFDA